MTKAKRKPKQNGIVIESGIAPPKARAKYPWKDMKVGDSFFVSGFITGGLLTSAYRYAKSHPGAKFRARKEKDGTRIWRIA